MEINSLVKEGSRVEVKRSLKDNVGKRMPVLVLKRMLKRMSKRVVLERWTTGRSLVREKTRLGHLEILRHRKGRRPTSEGRLPPGWQEWRDPEIRTVLAAETTSLMHDENFMCPFLTENKQPFKRGRRATKPPSPLCPVETNHLQISPDRRASQSMEMKWRMTSTFKWKGRCLRPGIGWVEWICLPL